PDVKFRINPSCAVMQNWQSTAHPACVETQIVCRPSLGINTASTDAGLSGLFFSVSSAPSALKSPFNSLVASPNENKYRTDPSVDANRCFTSGKVMVVFAAKRARKSAGKFVICAKSSFLSAYNAW